MRKKVCRFLAGIVAVICMFSGTDVSASQVNNGAIYTIETNAIENWPQGPDVYSETAVLMDAETGMILYNKGMNEKRYPASITKIMTALLALENCTLDEQVTFTEACLADQVAGSGNIGMQVGEVLTMEQCLMAVMVRSANDVATQVAEYVAGSVDAFVDMMNARAQELGCVNTHFVNASGMPDENHYSTAYDMALIFQEAIKNETFLEIIGTQSYTIEPTNMNSESRFFSCHHALVAQSAPEYYEGCFGGKTGVTDSSRNTLVSGASRNGMTLIAVAMRADAGEVVADHIQLFDYGFDQFERLEVEGGSVIVPKGTTVDALEVVEQVGEEKTKRSYYLGDKFVGKAEIIPTEEEEPEQIVPEETEIQEESSVGYTEETAEKQGRLQQTYRYIIYILAVLIGIVFAASIVFSVMHSKKRKKRRRNKNK